MCLHEQAQSKSPPPQLAVVVVITDPRTPEQYNGLIVTQQKAAAASKGKGKIVLTLSDESDYGESSSEHEWESEEGESVAQRFQHVQYNKKLAAKKGVKLRLRLLYNIEQLMISLNAFLMDWE
ncbi:hypothetical protein C0995_009094 [Termitomyces sp. Mi166|nr:hypothetical protein C0995_009094 [Termitomyces sp. Mi166\